jgi:integral membrane protein
MGPLPFAMTLSAIALWGAVRFFKLAAFAVLAVGIGAVIGAGSRRARCVAAYGLVVPGLVATWVSGWALMKYTGHTIGEPWILSAIAASVVALHAAFLVSHKEAPRAITRLLAAAGVAAALGVMVARSARWEINAAILGSAGITGALICLPWALRAPPAPEDGDDRVVLAGLRWIAWAEGLTLLLLLCVSMPLRRLAGIHIDSLGVLGWAHGVLVIVYLQALWSASRRFGWSWRRVLLGFVAALLPAGTFVFFAWIQKHERARELADGAR